MSFIRGPKIFSYFLSHLVKHWCPYQTLPVNSRLSSLVSLPHILLNHSIACPPLSSLHYRSLYKHSVCPPHGLASPPTWTYLPQSFPWPPLSSHRDLCLNNILDKSSLHGLPEIALLPLYFLSHFTFLCSFYYSPTFCHTFLWLVVFLSLVLECQLHEGRDFCLCLVHLRIPGTWHIVSAYKVFAE